MEKVEGRGMARAAEYIADAPHADDKRTLYNSYLATLIRPGDRQEFVQGVIAGSEPLARELGLLDAIGPAGVGGDMLERAQTGLAHLMNLYREITGTVGDGPVATQSNESGRTNVSVTEVYSFRDALVSFKQEHAHLPETEAIDLMNTMLAFTRDLEQRSVSNVYEAKYWLQAVGYLRSALTDLAQYRAQHLGKLADTIRE